MALYRIDGWDYWPSANGAASATVQTAAQADGWYDTNSSMTTITGRFGIGLGMGISGTAPFGTSIAEAIGRRFTTETCVMGQAIMIPPTSNSFQLSIIDGQGGNGVQFMLSFDDLGIIRLYQCGTSSTNSAGTTLGATTAAKVWHNSEWNFIELKYLIDISSGLVEVRVNKVTVMSFVGRTRNLMDPLLSQPAGWDSLRYACSGGQFPVYWDDRYVLDNTGASNTDYLGNVRVNCQLPIGAGDLTQMSVFGAASNWDAVNDPLLTEVEYVYSATMGNSDLYELNPNVAAQNILGVQLVGAHRQDDSTQLKSNLLMKTYGTVYGGADHYLAQTYHYYRDMFEVNPNTGVGWTSAELNALQGGQKVLLG